MSMKVIGRSLWFTAPRTAEIRSEELPELQEGEVLCEALNSLVSAGTEMNVYRGDIGTAAELKLSMTKGGYPFPVSYGYQVVARIVAKGPGVELPVGQRVFAIHPHHDKFVMPEMVRARIGATKLGEPRSIAMPLPETLSNEQAAFANLFAVALTGLLDAPVRIGDIVAVSGLGVVGTFIAWMARKTASKVILIDPLAERRRRAEWLGADIIVHPDNAVTAVMECSDGRGADVIFEASGAPAALQTGLAVAGMEATIAVLSYYGSRTVPLVLSPEFHYRRIRIISSHIEMVASGLQPRWDRTRRARVAYERLSDFPVEHLISHRVPFEQASEAYRMVDQSPAETLGVMLTYPRGEATQA